MGSPKCVDSQAEVRPKCVDSRAEVRVAWAPHCSWHLKWGQPCGNVPLTCRVWCYLWESVSELNWIILTPSWCPDSQRIGCWCWKIPHKPKSKRWKQGLTCKDLGGKAFPKGEQQWPGTGRVFGACFALVVILTCELLCSAGLIFLHILGFIITILDGYKGFCRMCVPSFT